MSTHLSTQMPYMLTLLPTLRFAGLGPIALVIDSLGAVSGYAQTALAALGLLAMLYALFKYRASIGKMLIFLIRKVTRSRGR